MTSKARPGMSTARCPEQWAGKTRLARARQAAGLPLTDLDHHAITRS